MYYEKYLAMRDNLLALDEVTIIRSKEYNLKITVDVTEDRNYGNPYFKVYDDTKYEKARVARIEFKRAQYVTHYKHNNEQNWRLNHKEIKMLIELLQSEKEKGLTVWQDAINKFNETVISKKISSDLLPSDFPLPNYRAL